MIVNSSNNIILDLPVKMHMITMLSVSSSCTTTTRGSRRRPGMTSTAPGAPSTAGGCTACSSTSSSPTPASSSTMWWGYMSSCGGWDSAQAACSQSYGTPHNPSMHGPKHCQVWVYTAKLVQWLSMQPLHNGAPLLCPCTGGQDWAC